MRRRHAAAREAAMPPAKENKPAFREKGEYKPPQQPSA